MHPRAPEFGQVIPMMKRMFVAATLVALVAPFALGGVAANHGSPYAFWACIQMDPLNNTFSPTLCAPLAPGCSFSASATSGTVTCVPPPTPNVTWQCAYVGAFVVATFGTVTGTSACANGLSATATATATPSNSAWGAAGSFPGDDDFPWTCTAQFGSVLDSGQVYCWEGDP